jgi:hypothetical protein
LATFGPFSLTFLGIFAYFWPQFAVGSPFNVTHVTHVGQDLKWTGPAILNFRRVFNFWPKFYFLRAFSFSPRDFNFSPRFFFGVCFWGIPGAYCRFVIFVYFRCPNRNETTREAKKHV